MAERTTKRHGPFDRWLDLRWQQARGVFAVIHETRFSFFVVLAAVIALLVNDQGREIAVRGGDARADLWNYPLATSWLALQAWFWSRSVLGLDYKRTAANPQPPLVTRFPRWLGIASCLIPIVALNAAALDGQTGPYFWWLIGLLILTLVGFIAFVAYRREFDQWMLQQYAHEEKNSDAYDYRFNRWFRHFTYLVALALMLLAWFAPRLLGEKLGAAPVLLLGLASIVPLGSRAVVYFHNSKFPVVTVFVVSALVLSSCDPHYVRELAPIERDSRPTLLAEFARWKQADAQVDARPTMVVVSASGGGITAAYWTSTVLAQLSRLDPSFTSRLFSISSVSGGSVGTTVFTHALNCAAPSADGFLEKVEGALHGDLLAPTLGTLLFNDMVFWIPGASVAAHYGWRLPDRATTFEQQLEAQWNAVFPQTCGNLDSSFLAQRHPALQRGEWRPLVFLNSTHQETGRPVIMSQVKLAAPDALQPFETAIDYFAVAQGDLRLSTAALNSARFPFVSPAGQVPYKDKPPGLAIGHLIDGGYFENDGAFTTLKLLQSLEQQLQGVRVIVIQISIDPSAPFERPPLAEPLQRTRERSWIADRVAHQPHFANEALAPLYGFIATRDAHQAAARDALRQWALERGDDAAYAHFRALIPQATAEREHPAQPPLGWLLSEGSEEQLSKRTLCLDLNHAQWLRLAAALAVPAEQITACGASEPPHLDVDRGFPP